MAAGAAEAVREKAVWPLLGEYLYQKGPKPGDKFGEEALEACLPWPITTGKLPQEDAKDGKNTLQVKENGLF